MFLTHFTLGSTIHQMPQPDRPNFSLPLRIIFGVIALWLIYWLLRSTGTV